MVTQWHVCVLGGSGKHKEGQKRSFTMHQALCACSHVGSLACSIHLCPSAEVSTWYIEPGLILRRIHELWPLILSITRQHVVYGCHPHFVDDDVKLEECDTRDSNPQQMLSPAALHQGGLPSWPSETLLILKSLVWRDYQLPRACC